MRALFDLRHPAQVLFFKDLVAALRESGDEVLISSRDKDETIQLLESLGLPHVCLSRMGKGLLGMGVELGFRVARMLRVARRFRPDVLVARTGITIALVGKMLGVPSVVFDDTEFAWLQIALSAPFATVVCTGLGYRRRFPGKELRFNAPPHLAYTHPSRFRPRRDVLVAHGIDPDRPYTVLRVKAWRAIHDLGVRGPGDEELDRLVAALKEYGRVIISTERRLPEPLCRHLNPLPTNEVLHLLAFARLYVGEGSCMAAEAACLGTPSIYLSPASRRGYLDALEQRYGHVTTVRNVQQAVERSKAWLEDPGSKQRAMSARERLLQESSDPFEFMLDVVRRYGRSAG